MNSILVLGSGQLGHMMAEASAKYSTTLDRFDFSSNKVLYSSSSNAHSLSIDDIIKSYDKISAEIEHLPENEFITAFKNSEKWINKNAFEIIPSRKTQKAFLDQIGVSTAPWQEINSVDELSSAFAKLGQELVFKKAKGGYDGRGQWVLEKSQINDLPSEVIGDLICESKVDFDYEVSLIGARGENGELYFFPLTRNYHDGGILRYSIAPILSESLQSMAEDFLAKILNKLDYVGVMGMECFVKGDSLIINELAPRVHNSGHWTQQGVNYSQFDLHVRAICGIGLPSQNQHSTPTVMLNLIGCDYNPKWWDIDMIDVHWYGKEKRPGRKLGHINFPISWCKNRENSKSFLQTLDEDHQTYFQDALALVEKLGF